VGAASRLDLCACARDVVCAASIAAVATKLEDKPVVAAAFGLLERLRRHQRLPRSELLNDVRPKPHDDGEEVGAAWVFARVPPPARSKRPETFSWTRKRGMVEVGTLGGASSTSCTASCDRILRRFRRTGAQVASVQAQHLRLRHHSSRDWGI